jgi:hypothetical protein
MQNFSSLTHFWHFFKKISRFFRISLEWISKNSKFEYAISYLNQQSMHWKNESVESTHWRRKIDDFWQSRSFDAKHCRFYRFRHRFYAFTLFCPKKSQMVRLGFEPTTLGSDFSINIVSVLAISATRLHIYVNFWKRGSTNCVFHNLRFAFLSDGHAKFQLSSMYQTDLELFFLPFLRKF